MESSSRLESEYKDVIEAIYRIVGAVEKRFDSLRETDREALKSASADLSRRLDGFPQLYATKADMAEAAKTLQKLEREAVSRETYEREHSVLEDAVATKLSAAIFQGFVENYRLEQDRLREERGDYLSQAYYEERHTGLVNQVHAVESWQYKIVGGLVFATFIAPLLTGILVYLFTSGKL